MKRKAASDWHKLPKEQWSINQIDIDYDDFPETTRILQVNNPAISLKLRGKSLGRSKGDRLPPRIRYPTVKKYASKRKKSEKTLWQTDPIAS